MVLQSNDVNLIFFFYSCYLVNVFAQFARQEKTIEVFKHALPRFIVRVGQSSQRWLGGQKTHDGINVIILQWTHGVNGWHAGGRRNGMRHEDEIEKKRENEKKWVKTVRTSDGQIITQKKKRRSRRGPMISRTQSIGYL